MHQSPIPSTSSSSRPPAPAACSAAGHRLPALLTAAAAGTTAILLGTGILLNSLEVTSTAVSVLWVVDALVIAVLMLSVCWFLARSHVKGRVTLPAVIIAAALVVQQLIPTLGSVVFIVMALAMPIEEFVAAASVIWAIRTSVVVLALLAAAAIALVAALRAAPGRRSVPVPFTATARAVILLGTLGAALVLDVLPWLVVGISHAEDRSIAASYVSGLGENLAVLLVIAAGLLLAASADGLLRWAAPAVLGLLQLASAAQQLLLAIRSAQIGSQGQSGPLDGVLEFLAEGTLPLAFVVGAVVVGALLALGQGRSARPLPSADGAAS